MGKKLAGASRFWCYAIVFIRQAITAFYGIVRMPTQIIPIKVLWVFSQLRRGLPYSMHSGSACYHHKTHFFTQVIFSPLNSSSDIFGTEKDCGYRTVAPRHSGRPNSEDTVRYSTIRDNRLNKKFRNLGDSYGATRYPDY